VREVSVVRKKHLRYIPMPKELDMKMYKVQIAPYTSD
jgi:hypothetical protein